MSMRSTVIAGIAALSVATTLPSGPLPSVAAQSPAAVIAPSPRASYHDVDLMAYIPVISDIAWAVVDAAYAVDGLATAVVETAAQITELVPVVRVLAPQIRYFFYYLVEPIVMYPVERTAWFVATQNPVYLVEIVEGIATCLTAFVNAQRWYFLEGGFWQWLNSSPVTLDTAVATKEAAPGVTLDTELVSARTTSDATPEVFTAPELTAEKTPVEPTTEPLTEPAPLIEAETSEDIAVQTDIETTTTEAVVTEAPRDEPADAVDEIVDETDPVEAEEVLAAEDEGQHTESTENENEPSDTAAAIAPDDSTPANETYTDADTESTSDAGTEAA
ncbi:hypothetical protein [Mycobacterium sp. MS1601]|uniref:hypothetical protein n=1 Tax=Mycobacterium sp. MS1601 TaxID=1936029 RepID=UPI0012F7F12E|nr:hypothetical protein [Mycobacterium sp. MS1601]